MAELVAINMNIAGKLALEKQAGEKDEALIQRLKEKGKAKREQQKGKRGEEGQQEGQTEATLGLPESSGVEEGEVEGEVETQEELEKKERRAVLPRSPFQPGSSLHPYLTLTLIGSCLPPHPRFQGEKGRRGPGSVRGPVGGGQMGQCLLQGRVATRCRGRGAPSRLVAHHFADQYGGSCDGKVPPGHECLEHCCGEGA